MSQPTTFLPKVKTGIAGLDQILDGGLPQRSLFLIKGESGTGKTTLGMQFLLEGVKAGEEVLYITLSETAAEIHAVAESHGWNLDKVHIYELRAVEAGMAVEDEQTIFPLDQVELREVTGRITHVIDEIRPIRIVFDSLNEIRLLADTPLRYRRQILAIRKILLECGATVLFLDRIYAANSNTTLHSLVTGVITLELMPVDYGDVRRRLRVAKMRGMPFHEGFHDFRICIGGLEVYPRLRIENSIEVGEYTLIQSGIAELDALVGGGLEAGTACLIVGQTGTGKTSTALLYAYAVAERGGCASLFIFEERFDTLFRRAAGMSLDLRPHIEAGRLRLHQINAGEISPGEFAVHVCRDVDKYNAEVVVIDSLNGYVNAMPQECLLMIQMHELLTYLGRKQVLTFLTLTQHGMVAGTSMTDIDMSYLADTVLMLRHFEAHGAIRQAISVIKKRQGMHERTIREMRLGPNGIRVGAPLNSFQGILGGNPVFTGRSQDLLGQRHEEDNANHQQ